MTETMTGTQEPTVTGVGELATHYMIELAGELYAVPQASEATLSWVQRPQEPTYMPTLPPWCLGLVNERNTPVLLIDLRALLGLPPREGHGLGEHARHVFVEHAGDTVGLLVDRTRRFRLLPAQPARADGEFVTATVRADDQTVRILNLVSIWRYTLQELGAPGAQGAVA